jgi:hypothetical protein
MKKAVLCTLADNMMNVEKLWLTTMTNHWPREHGSCNWIKI